jgi:hypothetical protein
MKKLIVISMVLFVVSCKRSEKKPSATEIKKELIITEVAIPSYIAWGNQRANLEEVPSDNTKGEVFRISRNTIAASSFAHTQDISINFESTYRVSVSVKATELNSFFGLRIVGGYPDRADAIFDLKEGTLIGVKIARDFRNPDATIEAMGDGWYKCSLTAEPYSESIKILFGPTAAGKAILGWEGLVDKKNDIFILPSSLTLEEIKL